MTVKSGQVADTGDIVPQTGIYLPDADHGFPTFLIKGNKARRASVVLDPAVSRKKGYRPTLWTLVEKVSDTSNQLPSPSFIENTHLRVEGGQPRPQTGYWFTPAKLDSRRHFKESELMPTFDSDYGSTIWQWDPNQSS